MKNFFLGLIRFYQAAISPYLGKACRFEPSCSGYCRQAVEDRGLAEGLWLGIKRLSRCHPWSQGGWDPVPAKR